MKVVFLYEWKPDERDLYLGWCPNSEDSVYLGTAVECMLLRGQDSTASIGDLTKVFDSRLRKVYRRSPPSSYIEWNISAG